jgi:hypothetical protein
VPAAPASPVQVPVDPKSLTNTATPSTSPATLPKPQHESGKLGGAAYRQAPPLPPAPPAGTPPPPLRTGGVLDALTKGNLSEATAHAGNNIEGAARGAAGMIVGARRPGAAPTKGSAMLENFANGGQPPLPVASGSVPMPPAPVAATPPAQPPTPLQQVTQSPTLPAATPAPKVKLTPEEEELSRLASTGMR